MDAIGQLASGVAHDFNNLLTVILGFAEVLTDDTDMVNRHGSEIAEIVKAAERAAGLTRQLLGFSRRRQHVRRRSDRYQPADRGHERLLGRLIGEHIEVTLALVPDLSRRVRRRRPARTGRDEPRRQCERRHAERRESDHLKPRTSTSRSRSTRKPLHVRTVRDAGHHRYRYGMTDETRRASSSPSSRPRKPARAPAWACRRCTASSSRATGTSGCIARTATGRPFKVYLPRAPAS